MKVSSGKGGRGSCLARRRRTTHLHHHHPCSPPTHHPQILDGAEQVHYRDLLTEAEAAQLDASLRRVPHGDPSARASVEEPYLTIAADRAQRPGAWLDLIAKEAGAAGAGAGEAAEGKEEGAPGAKKRGTFQFRQGRDDKRQWGANPGARPQQPQQAQAQAQAQPKDSPAADTPAPAPGANPAAEGEKGAAATATATATAAAPTAAPSPSPSPSPAASGPDHFAAILGNVDPTKMKQSEIDAKYEQYVRAVSEDQWKAYATAKDR